MISLRTKLSNIGITPDMLFSYQDSFVSHPGLLSQSIHSMDAPLDWQQISDIPRDDYWTDEVQGVAWDGQHWIFSCNANLAKPGAKDKSIYVFEGGQPLKDDNWKSRTVFHMEVNYPLVQGRQFQGFSHWGQLTYHNGYVYVSHFWEDGPLKSQTNVVVFKNNGGFLEYSDWIKLGQVPSIESINNRELDDYSYPEFQTINPWDGLLYTCRGGPNTSAFYAHDPKTGEWIKNKVLKFRGGEQQALYIKSTMPLEIEFVDLPSVVQGACFSSNGHLYLACDVRLLSNINYKAIACFSALNGYLMGIIPVLAKEGGQELEGVCYANDVFLDGRAAQIHAVLLENHDANLDNIFFKSFSADSPDLV